MILPYYIATASMPVTRRLPPPRTPWRAHEATRRLESRRGCLAWPLSPRRALGRDPGDPQRGAAPAELLLRRSHQHRYLPRPPRRHLRPGLEQIRTFLPSDRRREPGGRVFLDAQVLQRIAADLSLEAAAPDLRPGLAGGARSLAGVERAVLGQPQGNASPGLAITGHRRSRPRPRRDGRSHRTARAPHRPLALLKALRLDGDLALDANDFLATAALSLAEALISLSPALRPHERALTSIVLARFQAASGRPTEAFVSLDEARQILDPLEPGPALAQVETIVGWIKALLTSLPRRRPDPARARCPAAVAEGLTDAATARRRSAPRRPAAGHRARAGSGRLERQRRRNRLNPAH